MCGGKKTRRVKMVSTAKCSMSVNFEKQKKKKQHQIVALSTLMRSFCYELLWLMFRNFCQCGGDICRYNIEEKVCALVPRDASEAERNVSFLKNRRKAEWEQFPLLRDISKYLSCPWVRERRADRFQPGGGSLPSGMHTVLVCTFGKVTEITQDFDRKADRGRGIKLYKHKAVIACFHSSFFFLNATGMTHLLLKNKVSNLGWLHTRPSGHETAEKQKRNILTYIFGISSTSKSKHETRRQISRLPSKTFTLSGCFFFFSFTNITVTAVDTDNTFFHCLRFSFMHKGLQEFKTQWPNEWGCYDVKGKLWPRHSRVRQRDSGSYRYTSLLVWLNTGPGEDPSRLRKQTWSTRGTWSLQQSKHMILGWSNELFFVKQLIWKFVDSNGNCRIEDII